MEGAGVVREERQVTARADAWRIAAGIGVLVLLGLIAVLLAPPYYRDWELQGYIRALAHDPATSTRSTDLIQALVVDKAAGLGLPVRLADVHVARTNNRTRIEVLYIVHIEVPVYTVDLHFRPTA